VFEKQDKPALAKTSVMNTSTEWVRSHKKIKAKIKMPMAAIQLCDIIGILNVYKMQYTNTMRGKSVIGGTGIERHP